MDPHLALASLPSRGKPVRNFCHRAETDFPQGCNKFRRRRYCSRERGRQKCFGLHRKIEQLPCCIRFPHLSEERGLLPEVDSFLTAEEEIETVCMTGAVMTGKTVHGQAEEDSTDIGCDLIDPIEAVQSFEIVWIRPISTAS